MVAMKLAENSPGIERETGKPVPPLAPGEAEYRQAAALPWRRTVDGIEVMMVTSRRSRRWILPKGFVDPGRTPPETAINEAFEEAGVRGVLSPECVGRFRAKRRWGPVRTEVYALAVHEVLDDWPERDIRGRRWMPAAEAATIARGAALRRIIRKFARRDARRD